MTKLKEFTKLHAIVIMIIVTFLCTNTTSFYSAKSTPTISKTKISMTVGGKSTLKVTGASKTVKWSSNNSKIVKITKISGAKSCKVTFKAVKKGSATITAKVGSRKLKCKVTVKAKKSSTVYITPTGKKYHSTKKCPTLSRSKKIEAISLKNAKAKGYKPCKVCH